MPLLGFVFLVMLAVLIGLAIFRDISKEEEEELPEEEFDDFDEEVRIKRLTKTAQIPQYQTKDSAGLDLHADGLEHDIAIYPGDTCLIQTGLSLAVPRGYEGQIRSRSGLSLKQGLIVLNSPGTLDSDYRGPLGIILHNAGSQVRTVKQGDRIAQLVICPVVRAELVEVGSLDETARGSGGFGHTG